MQATFIQKVIICMIAGFLAAALLQWGKVFVTDPGRLEALYPQLPAFRELAERLDPEHKFRNRYLDRNVFAAVAQPAGVGD